MDRVHVTTNKKMKELSKNFPITSSKWDDYFRWWVFIRQRMQ